MAPGTLVYLTDSMSTSSFVTRPIFTSLDAAGKSSVVLPCSGTVALSNPAVRQNVTQPPVVMTTAPASSRATGMLRYNKHGPQIISVL